MATSSEEMNSKLTFRRFEDDDTSHYDWDEYIWQSSWSHKCPTYVHRTPPCQGSCPSGHDIRGWLDIVRGIEKPTGGLSWQEYAFRRMTESNPFPAMMGRVCPAPCEDGCNRNQVEDHVGINSVEHYIGNYALENGFKFEAPAQESGKKIAIVGGGVGGLSCAYQLRRKGHSVTVFDSHPELGGMSRYGIPGYRTPRDTLDGEINRILDMGVEARVNTHVGKDIPMADIENEYDAIVWAVGAQSGRGLPVDGWEGTPNCVSGVGFLEAFNKGKMQIVSGRVIVIGGGDTSIDVASVARRLGHITNMNDKDAPENVILGHTAHDVAATAVREGADVTLTSLFPVENMTAAEHEVHDAISEGVDIRGSVMPLEVITENGRAVALKMCECTMDGNRPVPTEGTEFQIDADLIVSAIGQFGNLEGLDELNNGRNFIDTDKNFCVKGREKHFAIGDIIRPHLLTTAIGHGSIAAESIHDFLAQKELGKRPKVDVHHFNLLNKLREHELQPGDFKSTSNDTHGGLRGTSEDDFAVHNYEDRSHSEIIPSDDLFLGHFKFEPRNKRDNTRIPATDVLGNFEERLIALAEEKAVEEAGRCMSCGMCFECDNCVIYCPQEAVKRTPKAKSTTGRYVFTDYAKCVGCHICADVCPTGYIQMGMGD